MREGEPTCGVCWAAPQIAFGRENRVQKVSARECARARACVRGRGSKQQQSANKLGRNPQSPSRAGKRDSAASGGTVLGVAEEAKIEKCPHSPYRPHSHLPRGDRYRHDHHSRLRRLSLRETRREPGLGAGMAAPRALLMCLGLPLFLLPAAQAQASAPPGCNPDLDPLYYNLCDRSGAWGIVLEAVAGAGVVTTFVLTIILVASLPFVQDTKKRSLLGTQVFFLLGTLGLFCLVFACVVKPDFATCASRRFLFGVLFAICFSCLVAHVFALNFLARKNHGPRGWVTFTVALLLTLVEVIINTEWLIITLVRGGGEAGPLENSSASWVSASPCAIANMDFVMALIYVMLLLLAAFTGAWPALCGRFKRWHKHGVFVLLTTATSLAIWVVWIVMYTYGNRQHNSPTWDDPTLAIALAANAWAFVLFYVIPEISHVTRPSPEQSYQGDMYPTRGVGYETILKEQKGQSMFVENKAFSMDEPASAKRPVSPYSGYNGQLLTSVYQPTEMALMHKGPSEGAYDVILPRATANSQVTTGSANSTLRAEDAYAAQGHPAATPPPDGRSSQAQSPQNKTRW
ncbi:G-protein coupled receptor family C group 5 member C isoform X2 [Dasypus novemcinctus]|uniref:G-protein coupled receptor family C group 5 member C isoform X2 n=1 Tax=Dasypus novemcinctus TaxID=9361 RepID=UPI00265F4732|nr:G-protein coupled receptor family C group 5 member C isoform X2 [Dasypus novemcinctus]